jgi:hypothetical protein
VAFVSSIVSWFDQVSSRQRKVLVIIPQTASIRSFLFLFSPYYQSLCFFPPPPAYHLCGISVRSKTLLFQSFSIASERERSEGWFARDGVRIWMHGKCGPIYKRICKPLTVLEHVDLMQVVCMRDVDCLQTPNTKHSSITICHHCKSTHKHRNPLKAQIRPVLQASLPYQAIRAAWRCCREITGMAL